MLYHVTYQAVPLDFQITIPKCRTMRWHDSADIPESDMLSHVQSRMPGYRVHKVVRMERDPLDD